jgi:hypothetical protein
VDRETESLFTEAVDVLARTTRRYPVNISSLNDIMRSRSRGWHCGRTTGGTFSTLCKVFEQRGLLEMVVRGHSVMVM